MMRTYRRVVGALLIVVLLSWTLNGLAQAPPPPDDGRSEARESSGARKPPAPETSFASAESGGSEQAPPPASGEDAVRTPAQPSAEDIMSAFERDHPPNSPVPARHWTDAPGVAADRQDDTSPVLLREGEYVYNAIGRLHRDGTWWALAFEADDPESPRRPLRLLPNQQLERMVLETKASMEVPVYVVSGEVTLFESHNYLLVRKALRRRTTENLDK